MSKPKIVSISGSSAVFVRRIFASRMDLSTFEFVVVPEGASEDEVCQAVAGATVILSGPKGTYISRRVIEAAHGVRLIQFGSVGYDGVLT